MAGILRPFRRILPTVANSPGKLANSMADLELMVLLAGASAGLTTKLPRHPPRADGAKPLGVAKKHWPAGPLALLASVTRNMPGR